MKRYKKLQIGILIAFLCFTLFGFFGVPPLAKYLIQKNLAEQTQRNTSIEKITFNPFTLRFQIEQLFVQTKAGDRTWVGFDLLDLDVTWKSLFKWGLVVERITLENPIGFVQRQADGSFNFSDLLERSAESTPQEEPTQSEDEEESLPKIAIGQLAIVNGQIQFEDDAAAVPFKTALTPINFTLENFSTFENADNRLSFKADDSIGTRFSWEGDFFPKGVKSTGRIELSQLKCEAFTPYFLNLINFEIIDTFIDLDFDYVLDLTDIENPFRIQNGQMVLSDLKIKPKQSDEFHFEIPQFTVSAIEVDALPQRLSVGQAEIAGGALLIRQDKGGEINLLKLAEFKATESTPEPEDTPAEPSTGKAWEYTIGKIYLHGFNIKAEDLVPETPAELFAEIENFTFEGFSSDLSKSNPFNVSIRLAESGQFKTEGELRLQPLKASTSLELIDYPLRSLQPYVETYAALAIGDGVFQAKGDLVIEQTESEQAPVISYKGDLSVNDLVTIESLESRDIFKVKQTALSGIDFQSAPLRVVIDTVALVEPAATLVRLKDNRFNVMTLTEGSAAPAPSTDTTEPAPSTAENQGDVTLKRLELTNANIQFMDTAVEPTVALKAEKITGVVENMTTDVTQAAKIDITGLVDGVGNLEVKGALYPNAFEKDTNLKLKLRGLDLVSLSSYSGKYVGKAIDKGNLSLEVECAINDSELQSKNDLLIDQFTFGESVESEEATSLPVGLAVSLLKDVNGKITLNLPVEGRIDDPEFSYFSIAFKVIGNLLVKAATAPFALLGNLVPGGDSESLSYVDFEPGQRSLTAEQLEKLQTLNKALQQRPNLRLELKGSYDVAADDLALKEKELEASLVRLYQETNSSKEMPDLGNAEISNSLLTQAYTAQVPVAEETPAKPAAKDEQATVEPPSIEAMKAVLIEAITIEEDVLLLLAQEREHAVKKFFVEENQLDPARIFISKSVNDEHDSAQVRFDLK